MVMADAETQVATTLLGQAKARAGARAVVVMEKARMKDGRGVGDVVEVAASKVHRTPLETYTTVFKFEFAGHILTRDVRQKRH